MVFKYLISSEQIFNKYSTNILLNIVIYKIFINLKENNNLILSYNIYTVLIFIIYVINEFLVFIF